MTLKTSPYVKAATLAAVLLAAAGCSNDSNQGVKLECETGLVVCGNKCCDGTCENGVCQTNGDENNSLCPQGFQECKGACVDQKTAHNHCGTCGHACEDNETCVGGTCQADACPTGFEVCNGACVNKKIDAENCGTCGNTCGGNAYCANGDCQCPRGYSDCDNDMKNGCEATTLNCDLVCEDPSKVKCESGACCDNADECCGATCCGNDTTCCGDGICADLQTSAEHCGSCNNPCTDGKSCVDGTCERVCAAPTPDLCEELDLCVNLANDALHCGNCSTRCDTTETCVEGKCTPSEVSCDADPDNPDAVAKTPCWGTCADLESDTANCGACGNACGDEQTCSENTCVCPEGREVCGDACVDYANDKDNCGSCGNACGDEQTCSENTCVCPEGRAVCGDACVDYANDKDNCGSCGNACDDGQVCEGGECATPHVIMCFGKETDILSDVNNCGACLHKCSTGETCTEGKCTLVCGDDYTLCNGACVNLQASAANCGACGKACADGQACFASEAGGYCDCETGRYDCDGLAANGCESTKPCACKKGDTQPCWRGAPENRGQGACEDGTQICDDSGQFWGQCTGGVYPSAITCNDAGIYLGGDQNCNGTPDEQEDCTSKCDLMLNEMSYIGCEYWPVFLQNYSGYSSRVYMDMTVVVSNPNDQDVDVYVFDKAKHENVSHQPYLSFKVPAGQVVTKMLVGDLTGQTSANNAVSNSGQTIYDYMLMNTMLAPYAFKLRSSLPVVVYQFNPYGKSNGYTADASLLLPSNVLGQDYIDLSYYSSNSTNTANTFTIVAVKPGTTTVDVTPSIATRSGTDKTNVSTIAGISANTKKTFSLKQFDVLHLQQEVSGEMTGSKVHADKPIAVFGGAACTVIRSYCDHTEEQLFPTSTWGKNYYAIRAGYNHAQNKILGTELDDYYILAQQDGTVVTITGNQGTSTTDTITLPAYSGGSGEKALVNITTNNNFKGTVTLNAGQFTKISTIKNFHVSATKPILVGQFIDDVATIGDPGYTLNVPVEQYRTDYSFSIPNNYEYDFVTLVAPKNTKIYYSGAGYKGTRYENTLLDTLPTKVFSGWMTVGNDNYVYGYLDIDSGTHHLQGDKKFGALGYGFGDANSTTDDTSYAYPIGLNLDKINNTN